MSKEFESYLNRLVGQTIVNITTDLSTIIPLKSEPNDAAEQAMFIYTQIYFNEYRLDVSNRSEIIFNGRIVNVEIKDLVGLTVVEAKEEKDYAALIFDNGYIFKIDLTDSAFNEPEAMSLFGPDDFWVVWN